jgi:hypothetical protein
VRDRQVDQAELGNSTLHRAQKTFCGDDPAIQLLDRTGQTRTHGKLEHRDRGLRIALKPGRIALSVERPTVAGGYRLI